MKRIPASAATRERLEALFNGNSEVEDLKGALCRRRSIVSSMTLRPASPI